MRCLLLLLIGFLGGCQSWMKTRATAAADPRSWWHPCESGDPYWVLGWVAAAGVVIGFLALLAKALGAPVPKKLVWTAVSCSVASWMLQAVLVQYMWLAALISVLGALAGVGSLVYLRWDRIIARLKGKK